jgi:hypothetical protein
MTPLALVDAGSANNQEDLVAPLTGVFDRHGQGAMEQTVFLRSKVLVNINTVW